MNEQKREQLIEWLESMPWWDELPYAKLKAELAESRAYADKLVDGIRYLPKDIEVLRDANHNFAQKNAELKREKALLRNRLEEVQRYFGSMDFPPMSLQFLVTALLADTQEDGDG